MTKKSVNLQNSEDENSSSTIPDNIPPLVPPPPPSITSKLIKQTKSDDSSALFTSIDIQKEDRFFYNNSDKTDSWSSNQTIITNPFDDPQNDNNIPMKELEQEQELIVEHDSDKEFDWNDDPDSKPKRRRTTRERFQAAMKNPCCWHYLSPVLKRILVALFGSFVFIIIAVVIHFVMPQPTPEQLNDPDFNNVKANVECWMYWAAFMWHIFWITTFLLDLFPSFVSLWAKIFKGRRSEKVKSYMEYYISLKKPLCLLLISVWNLSSWIFLINHPFESIKKHEYSLIITKVFACMITAAGLYFFQKTIVQYIAFKFHRTAFSERMAENKSSLKILDTLSKSEKKVRPVSSSAQGNLRKRKGPFQKKEKYYQLNDEQQEGSSLSLFKKSISKFVLAEKPTNSTGRIKADINSDDYAKKVAKKLFYALAYPEGHYANFEEEADKKYLTVFDFIPYFNAREQATEAFKIFDKDGNGDISRREFRDTVIYIYRERKGLAQAIRDTSQALGKIDLLLLAITTLITICICLAIFNVDFWTALIPFGTFLAACTFVFDTSAKSLFTGIMFQFITHPYDSGDLVMIDNTYMTVENIGILGTVFVAGDGTKLYAPTSVLMTKLITNVRRSGNMGETITFNVDFRTDNDLILVLREKLLDWIISQPRDFLPGFDLRVKDIVDMNQVILTCWLPHKGNWVDLGKRFQRKTRFMLALKTILTELDIKYELPAQRITTSETTFNTKLFPAPTDTSRHDTVFGPSSQNFNQLEG